MNRSNASTSTRKISTRQRWLFRAMAVLLGLAPLLAMEGVCVLFGWGEPSRHDDPFVGFRDTRPLFVLNEDQTRYYIPEVRQTYFRPESFAANKPDDEYRVFCLGGSTVQGRPFAIETSFTTWLELSLQAAEPSWKWEVVNCGGVSYASYRLTPILDEVLEYEPDLIVLYTGHNEFLEDRTFEHVRDRGAAVNAALAAASNLRTYNVLREGYLRLRGAPTSEPPRARPILPTEVEALLDYRGGLEEYHRDPQWRRGVIAQYEFNVRRMVQMAEEADVPLILVNPVSNLRNSPPFKSENRDDLTAAERERWESLVEAARRHFRGEDYNLLRATALLEQACEIDPLHAATVFTLANCYDALGRTDEARAAYLRAKELDVCPLRILAPMNEAVLRIARETDTPLLDAQALFEERSRDGIVGGEWLLDHVHPGVEGHQLLADKLAGKLVDLGIVDPRPGWESRKEAAFETHLNSLDDLYFLEGMQRLEALRNWAGGRMERVRPPESP